MESDREIRIKIERIAVKLEVARAELVKAQEVVTILIEELRPMLDSAARRTERSDLQ